MSWKESKKFALTFLLFQWIIALILLAFYKFVKASLFLGFLIGSATSYIIFEIRSGFSHSLIKRQKRMAVFLTILAFILILLLVGLITLAIIFINKWTAKNSTNIYDNPAFQASFYPINIVAFCAGLALTKISILITFLTQKERRHETSENNKNN